MTDERECCHCEPTHWTLTATSPHDGSPCPGWGPPDDGQVHPIPEDVYLAINGVPLGVNR